MTLTLILGGLLAKALPYVAGIAAIMAAVFGYGAKKKAEGAKRALDQVERNNANVVEEIKRNESDTSRLADDELARRLSEQQRDR